MRKIFFMVCIIALVTGCAASFKEKRALSKPLVSLAMGKIQQEEYQGALVELRRAIEANPKDPEAYYALALAYWKTEKLDKALENADKAITYADNLDLDHPGLESEANNLKGTILVLKGENEKAIDAFQRAVKDELYQTPEYAYYNLASVYLDLDRYDEAQKAAQEALDGNPHYAPAWKISGDIYLKQRDERQAIEAYNHAVLEFKGYTEAYWNLAQVLIKRGQKREARANLNEVIKLDPNGFFGSMAKQRLDELD